MRLMPSCHDVQTELTDYLEGVLPWRRRLGIWIHLQLCRVCAGVLRGLRALPDLSRQLLAPEEPVPEAALRALAKMQQKKAD